MIRSLRHSREFLVYFGWTGPFFRALIATNIQRHVTTSMTRKSFLTRLTAFVACFGLGSKLTARSAALPAAATPVADDLPIQVRPESRAVSRQATGF